MALVAILIWPGDFDQTVAALSTPDWPLFGIVNLGENLAAQQFLGMGLILATATSLSVYSSAGIRPLSDRLS